MGLDNFVLRRLNKSESAEAVKIPIPKSLKRLYVVYRVGVEWGIGGLKIKFKRFVQALPNRIPLLSAMLRAAAILTNFIQLHMHDFSILLEGEAGGEDLEWYTRS